MYPTYLLTSTRSIDFKPFLFFTRLFLNISKTGGKYSTGSAHSELVPLKKYWSSLETAVLNSSSNVKPAEVRSAVVSHRDTSTAMRGRCPLVATDSVVDSVHPRNRAFPESTRRLVCHSQKRTWRSLSRASALSRDLFLSERAVLFATCFTVTGDHRRHCDGLRRQETPTARAHQVLRT